MVGAGEVVAVMGLGGTNATSPTAEAMAFPLPAATSSAVAPLAVAEAEAEAAHAAAVPAAPPSRQSIRSRQRTAARRRPSN